MNTEIEKQEMFCRKSKKKDILGNIYIIIIKKEKHNRLLSYEDFHYKWTIRETENINGYKKLKTRNIYKVLKFH